MSEMTVGRCSGDEAVLPLLFICLKMNAKITEPESQVGVCNSLKHDVIIVNNAI